MSDKNNSGAVQWILAKVHSIRSVADETIEIELRKGDGSELPAFDAGSHIDIEIPGNDAQGKKMIRQYSLCSDPAERHRYLIGVGLDANSLGGSRYLHQQLKVDDLLQISKPRNNFAVNESAAHTVLIAGGIGITPLLSMARRLSQIGKSWILYQCARTPSRAAFTTELQALSGRVVQIFDGIPNGVPINLPYVISGAPKDTHFYCCGPASLMSAFETAASQLSQAQVHVEWFKAKETEGSRSEKETFRIKLNKSGRELEVPKDKTILDVLQDAGINVQFSCCQGVCGSCETNVLEGTPDHRDTIFANDEANVMDRMMICVSRAKSESLTLDI